MALPAAPRTPGGSATGRGRRAIRRLARRRWLAGGVAAVVVAGVALAFADPFGSGPAKAGVTDNNYPTSTATIVRQTLAQQSEQSATLGFAGSYSVAIPTGTAQSALEQAQTTAQSAEAKVTADEQALANARALQATSGTSSMMAARAQLASDELQLADAESQLRADQQLSCPAASSTTVGSPIGGSSPSGNGGSGNPGSGNPGSGNPGSGNPGSGNPGGSNAGNPGGSTTSDPPSSASPLDKPPSVSTGSAAASGTDGATVSGTVDPNGSSTSYFFEYGTSAALGSETPSVDAGPGTSPVSASATIGALKPNTTYSFALVASNAYGTVIGTTETFQTGASSCVEQRQVMADDEAAVAEQKYTISADQINASTTLAADEAQLTTDEQAASSAEQLLSEATVQATNPGARFTSLPGVGQVIRRGQAVYALDGHPVPLFYGTVVPSRALYPGVSDGPDVRQLEANLIALGFGAKMTAGNHFSAAAEAAVKAWQASIGVPQTGKVALGDVVVEPGPIEVDTVSAAVGAASQPGAAVLSATSTNLEVTIALDASQQGEVKVGDPVSIVLPNNSTTPGVVSSVGTVASSASSGNGGGNGGGSSPTVTVEVTPTRPAQIGNLDQAPVNVWITTGTAPNALVVPVDALLALASGGYALELVEPGGAHQLVAVSLGLFDDADGNVQVTGDIRAGEKIVTPAL